MWAHYAELESNQRSLLGRQKCYRNTSGAVEPLEGF